MIKKELFKNKRMKAVAAAAALSASISLSGCTSAVQTSAQIETTSLIHSEEDTAAETPSSSVAEIDEVKEVQDTVAPAITVSNPRIEVVEGTDINLMDGVHASDEKDGDLTSSIMVSKYDTSIVDVEQTITYTVSDEAGNEATATAVILIKNNPIEALDKTMYTISSVNVRSGSNQGTEKLGSLAYAQSVHVTGQDKNTGWYQVNYNDSVGYVSSSYLSDTKPAPKPVTATSTQKESGSTNSSKVSGGGNSSSSGDGSSSTQAPAQPDNSNSSESANVPVHDAVNSPDLDKMFEGSQGW